MHIKHGRKVMQFKSKLNIKVNILFIGEFFIFGFLKSEDTHILGWSKTQKTTFICLESNKQWKLILLLHETASSFKNWSNLSRKIQRFYVLEFKMSPFLK